MSLGKETIIIIAFGEIWVGAPSRRKKLGEGKNKITTTNYSKSRAQITRKEGAQITRIEGHKLLE